MKEINEIELWEVHGGLLFLVAIPLAKVFCWVVVAGLAIGGIVLDHISNGQLKMDNWKWCMALNKCTIQNRKCDNNLFTQLNRWKMKTLSLKKIFLYGLIIGLFIGLIVLKHI